MTRTFYIEATSPNKAESDSEPEAREPSLLLHAEGSGVGEEMDVQVDKRLPSPASANGGSNTENARFTPRRGIYTKGGPTVYKLVKPVLRAIKEARSRQ